jgi:hypothetical protein
MTLTSATTDVLLRSRNLALVSARVVGGLIAALQLAGGGFFLLLASDDAVWLGPWVDVPVLTALFAGALLMLAMAVAPKLTPHRRIRVGLVAVGLGVISSLIKSALYDGPESLTFLAVDAVVLALLLLAGRAARATGATERLGGVCG